MDRAGHAARGTGVGSAGVALQTKLRDRLKAEMTKECSVIRLSPEVVGAFRATGDGGHTRMDAALRDWLKNHSPA